MSNHDMKPKDFIGKLIYIKKGMDKALEVSGESNDLKPCPNPSCGNPNVSVDICCDSSYVSCPVCYLEGPIGDLEYAKEKWNALPRKIKMTKELPTEEGSYFWAPEAWCEPVMGEIDYDGDFDNGLCTEKPETMGGYWAKVDQSMFEFEG